MHRSRRLVALGAASAMFLAACSGGGAPAASSGGTGSQAPASQGIDYKACVAFDAGGLGDKGFNDLALKGLEEAKAAGYDTAYSEATGASDYAANIQRLMDVGCQTIITVGFNQTEATIAATKANEDIAFSQVDATWDEEANGPTPANFTGIDFQIDEAATVAGYLAAGFSESKIIGTYGGQQFAGVTRFMDGMVAGANIYNDAKGTDVKVLGWDPTADGGKGAGTFVGGDNPWNDPAKGEQLARTLLDQGADIVHPVAGATGNGTIKAMAAAGKWAIGVDSDQALSLAQYADAIITSAEKRIDAAVLDVIEKNAGGDLGGENYLGTLENGGVAISPYHEFEDEIPDELKAEVDKLAKDIASGAVKIADHLK